MESSLAARVPGAAFGPELAFWEAGHELVIGVDEAGRGPLAGPVVAAAVVFAPEIVLDGIADSKRLTAGHREKLDIDIRNRALEFAVCESGPGVIDAVNILEATRRAMRAAVLAVAAAVGATDPLLLVDGRMPPLLAGRQHNIVHGDSLSFTIGAASVLAKVHRDRQMLDADSEHPRYGFARHKGYPTSDHRRMLLRHGRCGIHRTTFTIARSDGRRVTIGDLPLRVSEGPR
ncbi:MAG: Ribonuclease HII [Calditrichaeota bacterium]|nr:Ribonuclease HII [Calditrichota bacterium]